MERRKVVKKVFILMLDWMRVVRGERWLVRSTSIEHRGKWMKEKVRSVFCVRLGETEGPLYGQLSWRPEQRA